MYVGINVKDKTDKKGTKAKPLQRLKEICMVDGIKSLLKIQGKEISALLFACSITQYVTNEVKSGKNGTAGDRTSLVRMDNVGKNELETSGNSLGYNFIVSA